MRDRSDRYSSVPWLADVDLRPMGAPETVVELAGGEETALGLLIREPFGSGTDAILTVHAIRGDGNDGGDITLAITNQLYVEPVVEWRPQSNPIRQADGDPGDD